MPVAVSTPEDLIWEPSVHGRCIDGVSSSERIAMRRYFIAAVLVALALPALAAA
jgi:hypothetical protein